LFTILESFGSVYLFRRIENDLHCGDTSVLDRFQGFLNLFHTNALVKNLEVLQLHSFTVFSAAGEGMRRDSWNRFKTKTVWISFIARFPVAVLFCAFARAL
jgi:hypothetical protein